MRSCGEHPLAVPLLGSLTSNQGKSSACGRSTPIGIGLVFGKSRPNRRGERSQCVSDCAVMCGIAVPAVPDVLLGHRALAGMDERRPYGGVGKTGCSRCGSRRSQTLRWARTIRPRRNGAGQSPAHDAYTMLSGAPVRNYRGDVLITWEVSFDSRIPRKAL